MKALVPVIELAVVVEVLVIARTPPVTVAVKFVVEIGAEMMSTPLLAARVPTVKVGAAPPIVRTLVPLALMVTLTAVAKSISPTVMAVLTVTACAAVYALVNWAMSAAALGNAVLGDQLSGLFQSALPPVPTHA